MRGSGRRTGAALLLVLALGTRPAAQLDIILGPAPAPAPAGARGLESSARLTSWVHTGCMCAQHCRVRDH